MNEVAIHTYLAGVRTFLANAQAEALAIRELGVATKETGLAMATTTRRSWLMNQSLFTARRLVYGLSLGFIAGGAAVLKWGNDYNTAIQGARVTLSPFFHSSRQLEGTLNQLWTIAKYSPFQIQDMTLAFNKMYPSMSRLGITAPQVTRTLKDLTDALTVGMAGRVTPAALNRASVALQHLAFLGRLTGMSVLQLARDGIPIYAALSKELGLTADQMHNIGKLGIPASVALEAINRYIESTPGYADAARRLSNRSVSGLLSQMKDNISKTMGLAETSWFASLRRMLTGANFWFNKLNVNLKQTHNLAKALDLSLTPNSHIVLRVWGQIRGTVQDAWIIFKALISTLAHSRAVWATLVLALLIIHGVLASVAHTTFLWVPVLKVLIPLLIAWRIWTLALTTASYAYITALWLTYTAEYALTRAKIILGAASVILTLLMGKEVQAANGQFVAFSRLEWMTIKLRRAFIGLGIAEFVSNPITLAILAVLALTVGLVVLYYRWRRFHNMVNATSAFIKRNWYWIALIPVIGPFIVITNFIIRNLHRIVGLFKTAAHYARMLHPSHWLGGIGHAIGGVGHAIGLQHGGVVSQSGAFMVGERGPELLHLPRGAAVTPTTGIGGGLAGMIRIYPQQIKIQVDGRTLAEVIARHQTAVNARA